MAVAPLPVAVKPLPLKVVNSVFSEVRPAAEKILFQLLLVSQKAPP